jgi:DNA-binding NtrC family response regulator
VWVLAATNQGLDEKGAAGQFRGDLLHRLRFSRFGFCPSASGARIYHC